MCIYVTYNVRTAVIPPPLRGLRGPNRRRPRPCGSSIGGPRTGRWGPSALWVVLRVLREFCFRGEYVGVLFCFRPPRVSHVSSSLCLFVYKYYLHKSLTPLLLRHLLAAALRRPFPRGGVALLLLSSGRQLRYGRLCVLCWGVLCVFFYTLKKSNI